MVMLLLIFEMERMKRAVSFKNRSRVEIIYDVVNTTRQNQPILKTTLLRKANISYLELMTFLDFVISQGLLEERIVNESRVYFVTQKGFKFLEVYEELQNVIKSAQNESHSLIESKR